MMRPFQRRSGPMLTPRARLWLAAALIAGLALSTLLASLDTNPAGEGDPLPPLSFSRGQEASPPRSDAAIQRSH